MYLSSAEETTAGTGQIILLESTQNWGQIRMCVNRAYTSLGVHGVGNHETWGSAPLILNPNYAASVVIGGGNPGTGAAYKDLRNNGGLHLQNSKGISFAASTNGNSRHWRIRNDDYCDHGGLQFSVSDTYDSYPDAQDESVMTMSRSRYVGIGTEYPAQRLQIVETVWNASEAPVAIYKNNSDGCLSLIHI